MDIMLLKKAAKQSVALMIVVITLSYAIQHYQSITIEASKQIVASYGKEDPQSITVTTDQQLKQGTLVGVEDSKEEETFAQPPTDASDLKSRISEEIRMQLSENFLVVKKPVGKRSTISLTDLYMERAIELNLGGRTNYNLTSEDIFRVRGNELFYGEPIYTEISTIEVDKDSGESEEVITKDYGMDLSHGIRITTSENKLTNQYSTRVLIELDTIYAYEIFQDDNYYYIDLKRPSEVYDKILVIDPGHGGKDVGAISKNNQYYEKDINLDITRQLQKLLEKEDIKVYYTRAEDNTVFLRPRVTLANEVDCDYFISIHCNSNTLSSPHGSEVLFYNTEFKGIKSKDLANVFAEELSSVIPLRKRGTIMKKPEDLFIMDNAKVPTVLIEVGYMSNTNDMKFLSAPENREMVAQGIYNGIMRAFMELPVME